MSQSSPSTGAKTPLLSDKLYTVLKHVAAIGLPALTALYFALAQIWHFPDTANVMASIAAVNTCLGALLGYSSMTYNNGSTKYVGDLNVVYDPVADKKTFTLAFDGDPNDIEHLNEATFKVTPVPLPPASPNTAHGAYIPPSS